MTDAAFTPASTAGPHLSAMRLARIGVWAATLALLLASAALCVSLWFAATGYGPFVKELLSDFGLIDYLSDLTAAQTWFAALVWCLVDLLGIAMLWNIRALFQTYRRGDVFSPAPAARLRRIGWIILAMAPVSVFGMALGGAGLSLWALDGMLHGQVSIDDTDIYALIIGLVLVAAGHMMALAAQIDAENREFI